MNDIGSFRCGLNLSCRDQLGEMLKRTIVSLFSIRWETASGQLSALQVVLDALAADTRPGTSAHSCKYISRYLLLSCIPSVGLDLMMA